MCTVDKLAHIAVTLQAGDDLRDMEGDMRVNVYAESTAATPEDLQTAVADTKDTDASVLRQHWSGNSDVLESIQKVLNAADSLVGTEFLGRIKKMMK